MAVQTIQFLLEPQQSVGKLINGHGAGNPQILAELEFETWDQTNGIDIHMPTRLRISDRGWMEFYLEEASRIAPMPQDVKRGFDSFFRNLFLRMEKN